MLQKDNLRGFTLIELIVAMAIFLVVLAMVQKFLIDFTKQATKQEIKAKTIEEIKEIFRIIEDDIRHSGFGYPSNNPNVNNSICRFSVTDNCSVGDETFCKDNTDRFFIADGWKIIRDNTQDNCPDGLIDNLTYETLASGNYFAGVTNYTSGTKIISVDKLDIDTTCRKPKTSTVLCGTTHAPDCDDIKGHSSVIICGCANGSGDNGQEGRRISGISSLSLNFISKESALNYDNCSNGAVLPAIAWYVRKDNENVYWLYRNEKRVFPNVENFQVIAGYDNDSDGIVDTTELSDTIPDNAVIANLRFFLFRLNVGYEWNKSKYYMDYSFKVEVTP